MNEKTIDQLNEDELKLQIKNATSKNLAGYVITYRLLGIYKNVAALCMTELLERRDAGDDFNFEEYIDNEVKSSPKPQQIDLKKIKNIIKFNQE